jgi:hypothetical protein
LFTQSIWPFENEKEGRGPKPKRNAPPGLPMLPPNRVVPSRNQTRDKTTRRTTQRARSSLKRFNRLHTPITLSSSTIPTIWKWIGRILTKLVGIIQRRFSAISIKIILS